MSSELDRDFIAVLREKKGVLVRLVMSLDAQHARSTPWQTAAWRSLLARIHAYALEEHVERGSVASGTRDLLYHAEFRLQHLDKGWVRDRSLDAILYELEEDESEEPSPAQLQSAHPKPSAEDSSARAPDAATDIDRELDRLTDEFHRLIPSAGPYRTHLLRAADNIPLDARLEQLKPLVLETKRLADPSLHNPREVDRWLRDRAKSTSSDLPPALVWHNTGRPKPRDASGLLRDIGFSSDVHVIETGRTGAPVGRPSRLGTSDVAKAEKLILDRCPGHRSRTCGLASAREGQTPRSAKREPS
jgi:hypothetical protein